MSAAGLRDLAWRIGRRLGRRENRDIARTLQSCGSRFRVGRDVHISHPRWVCVGNDVRMGDGVRLEAAGGVTIAHGTTIARRATIRTTAEPTATNGSVRRPVLIGRGVRIGPGARIGAGSRIGDGAVIPADAVIEGDVDFHVALDISDEPDVRFVFIVSTGRSGTTTMARFLSRHPEIRCRHERRPQLIRLSAELAHGIVDEQAVAAELDALYRRSGVYRSPIYGESDHRLFNLVGSLGRLLPSSRFIWLIRDGRSVVASTVARGWYAQEYESGVWGEYRLRGDLCGDLSHTEWVQMSPFEKNCWYWDYVNRVLERQLDAMDPARWMRFRLSSLQAQGAALFEFLRVEPVGVKNARENASRRAVIPAERWTEAEHRAFERRCGGTMDRWYPGWRERG